MPIYEEWILEQSEEIKAMMETRFSNLEGALKKERRMRKMDEDVLNQISDKKLTKELREAATLGAWLESRLHLNFTVIADDMYGGGYVNRDERLVLSAGIGEALKAFTAYVEQEAPQIYKRRPWEYPEDLEEGQTRLEGDFIPLLEAAVSESGRGKVKIIQPGWGSSGYYPADMLERDGPAAFPAGLHMYWDHPTESEDWERPERSLRDLAGTLETEARWENEGPDGPGLYADVKIFDEYAATVKEIGEHIGVSIRALGSARQGEVEGRSGLIIDELVAAKSVDYVTLPGAGGKVLEVFEAARGRETKTGSARQPESQPISVVKESENMDEVKELQESNAALQQELEESKQEAARLREASLVREAKDKVAEALREANLPDVTKTRLTESLAANPPTTDEGKLDEEKLAKQVVEAIKTETEYLAKATGSGTVNDLGESQPLGGENPEEQIQESEKVLEDSLGRMGLDESTAKIAAKGRG